MKYYKQLDALRFYSVTWVVFSHIPLLTLHPAIREFFMFIPGVQLFFCISGFLITGIVLENSSNKAAHFFQSFYVRRFLRIFPIYYLTVLVLAACNFENYRSTWLLYDLFYVSNIRLGQLGSFDANPVSPHFWSLAVEEQFYLLWPGLLFFINKKNHRYLLGIFLFGLGVIPLVLSGSFMILRTIGNLSYLISGCLIAIYFHYDRERALTLSRTSNYLLLIGLVLVASIAIFGIPVSDITRVLITVFLIPVILLKFILEFRNPVLKRIFENPAIVYLGKISYGIYIYHMFALYPLIAIQKLTGLDLSGNALLNSVCKILLTILISVLSWEFFEKRLNRLKSNYKYKKSLPQTEQ